MEAVKLKTQNEMGKKLTTTAAIKKCTSWCDECKMEMEMDARTREKLMYGTGNIKQTTKQLSFAQYQMNIQMSAECEILIGMPFNSIFNNDNALIKFLS